jgi:hypothetical protein
VISHHKANKTNDLDLVILYNPTIPLYIEIAILHLDMQYITFYIATFFSGSVARLIAATRSDLSA